MNYFNKKEIECKCRCGLDKLAPLVLDKINLVREKVGKPLFLNSACRCQEHNKACGGKPSSAHTPQKDGLTYAVDFRCSNSYDRYRLIEALTYYGCTRIGISERFIHADWSPYHRTNVMWTY